MDQRINPLLIFNEKMAEHSPWGKVGLANMKGKKVRPGVKNENMYAWHQQALAQKEQRIYDEQMQRGYKKRVKPLKDQGKTLAIIRKG